ncbi:hypothetical protein RSAG8_10286, partial [Rhizoctonia solani AG-8 WAC10335]
MCLMVSRPTFSRCVHLDPNTIAHLLRKRIKPDFSESLLIDQIPADHLLAYYSALQCLYGLRSTLVKQKLPQDVFAAVYPNPLLAINAG